MKKTLLILMSLCLILFSCKNEPNDVEESKTLKAITVTTAPTKLDYEEGESFSTDGMVVNATFSDNSIECVKDYDYTPKGPLSIMDKKITISYTYEDVTRKTYLNINVKEKKTLESIFLTQDPEKTNYLDGEEFNPKGMIISARFSDETIETVTDYTFTPQILTYTDETITISYKYGEIIKTLDFQISVEPIVKSIKVTKNPDKTDYKENEEFIPDGMEITAYYSNNKSKVITKYEYSPSEKISLLDKNITIKYEENGIIVTTEVAINVFENTPSYNINFDYNSPKINFGEFSISGGSYEIKDGIVKLTATEEKTEYTISGYYNGQIINTTKNTILSLKNVYIENTAGLPAIVSTKKLEISAKANTENYIISSGDCVDKIGTVYCYDSELEEHNSKNLELGGKGTCYIVGLYHGIKADEVKVKGSGLYYITGTKKGSAVNCNSFLIEADKEVTLCLGIGKNGIKADNSISISSGTLWFENVKTAMKTDTKADDEKANKEVEEHFINVANCKIYTKTVDTVYSTEPDSLIENNIMFEEIE